MKNVGLVLAHGNDAEDSKGRFFTELAIHFAKKGHVVMRYYCKQKEQRRQRIFERSVDTAAASPYARNVKKWIYVGHENGARIAALIGYKSPKSKAGFVFLSYPLLEPAPPPPKQKAGAIPPADSIGPLVKLIETVKSPLLFINGELDYNCPGADLKALAPKFQEAGVDARAAIFPDLDAKFIAPNGNEASPEMITFIEQLIEKFIDCIDTAQVSNSTLELKDFDVPRVSEIEASERVPPRPEATARVVHDVEVDGGDDEDEEQGNQQQIGMGGSDSGVGASHQFVPGSMLTPQQQQHIMLMQQRAAAMGLTPAQMQMAIVQQQMAAAAAAMEKNSGGGQGQH